MNTNSNLEFVSRCIVQSDTGLKKTQWEITGINGGESNTFNGTTIMFHLKKIAV